MQVMRILGIAILVGSVLTGCTSSKSKQVSFQEDVWPILKAKCVPCHSGDGEGLAKSGLSMESYETLMKGTQYGPVIVPGQSLTSTLNMLVEGRADPSIKMPHAGQPLSEEEIRTLKLWVDQGAKMN